MNIFMMDIGRLVTLGSLQRAPAGTQTAAIRGGTSSNILENTMAVMV